jgi:hypothetical protein
MLHVWFHFGSKVGRRQLSAIGERSRGGGGGEGRQVECGALSVWLIEVEHQAKRGGGTWGGGIRKGRDAILAHFSEVSNNELNCSFKKQDFLAGTPS